MAENKKQQIIKKFLIRAVISFVIWTVVFNFFIVPHTKINSVLTESVVIGSAIGLKFLGYEIGSEIQQSESNTSSGILTISNEPAILVADACNGLELFALYAGFIICFPGKFKYKAIFLPIGIAILFLVNILREIALALNYHFYKVSFDFNHHYTFAILVYLIVFLIWRYWLNNFSTLSSKVN
ncbi:MAG: exosortase/archaeosortase family protein [bacterium]|nr:exosortase/archaeosortase family protein [bacterium]